MTINNAQFKGGSRTATAALLAPKLFPPAFYYALMWNYREAYIDPCAQYSKNQKDSHRFSIADTRGRIDITIPVSRPSGARTWNEILVSDHGNWDRTLPIALESAYGRTPFFEFYIDRLRPVLTYQQGMSISELCLQTDRVVRDILAHPTVIVDKCPEHVDNFTQLSFKNYTEPQKAYWQIRDAELGFLPGLSILDLIFNLGPEAQLYLNEMAQEIVI